MTVTHLQLLFDSGGASQMIRVMPQTRESQVSAALRNMTAEARADFRHRLRLRMADGSLVVAKPKVSA